MKKIIKKVFLLLIVILLLCQFIPKKNNNTGVADGPASITSVHAVPEQVVNILKTSCYDCHSNHTEYPWYSNIQPLSWWLNDHVQEGKRELNFSDFGNYSVRRQYHKLEEINEQIEDQEMPLSSYTIIHQNAKISNEQAEIMKKWVISLRDSFKLVYPEDSLKRRKR
jgi:hypothetical protein